MKNIILAVMLCYGYILSAQTLSYNDIGVLFTQENINGSARYNGMSGAFGALGGDMSATENPAGLAVYLNSEFTITFTNTNLKTATDFYQNTGSSETDFGNIYQAGGVVVFDTRANSGWNKVALGFNYSMVNDFENFWFAEGNSGFAPITDFYDNDPSPASTKMIFMLVRRSTPMILNIINGFWWKNITMMETGTHWMFRKIRNCSPMEKVFHSILGLFPSPAIM